jgi:hypothetical protein
MDLKVAESQSHDDKRVPGFLQDQFGVCRRAIWVQEGREPMVEPANVGRFSGSVLDSRKSRGLGQVILCEHQLGHGTILAVGFSPPDVVDDQYHDDGCQDKRVLGC